METKLNYLQDTYQYQGDAKIINASQDEKGPYVIFDQTIFYPQGGGQPSDTGMIEVSGENIEIKKVRTVGDEIRHYISGALPEFKEQKVHQAINLDKRILHARYHSAGHLISKVVAELSPSLRAVKGHHFPGEAYVEFLLKGPKVDLDQESLESALSEQIAADIPLKAQMISGDEFAERFKDLPYDVPKDKQLRIVSIGETSIDPCGGTHVKSLGELGAIKITRIKLKKGRVKISYEVV